MISLQDLLYRAPLTLVKGNLLQEVRDFHFDSRVIQPGDLFVACKGTQVDGHQYISAALKAGAIAVVCEELPIVLPDEICWIQVKDSEQALAAIAANYFERPSDSLIIVGVTGTNGKTTTATLLYQLGLELGYPVGLISTVTIKIGNREIPATHTTPDARSLHLLFRQMVDAGIAYVFMEVSSHALAQQRVWGIQFSGAIFTNLTHDHLDYHGTFEAYIKAKQLLFSGLPTKSFAITNTDDRNGNIMLQNSVARKFTYSLHKPADFQARILENTPDGLQLLLGTHEVWSRLRGSFNAANLLAVYATAQLLDWPEEEVLIKMSQLEGVNGRFQTFQFPGEITAVVDYAHTPDALQNILENIKLLNQRNGRILTVVGCGGNRDQTKRPEMARIAAQFSDQLILTSDNPRDENPETILDQMETGVPIHKRRNVIRITDRKQAIRAACNMAQPQDILLLAGKGHETYQEIAGIKYPFDDRQILTEIFNER
jgi:UDP-N-acetylmuramoyl-L-alanyl-D-glutamate--2,6-diaminopimelate ligase